MTRVPLDRLRAAAATGRAPLAAEAVAKYDRAIAEIAESEKTSFIDADHTPIESAALRLNTLHHHLDMPARRREARVAAEGLLDVEVMARVLVLHTVDRLEITTQGDYLVCSHCGGLAAGVTRVAHIAGAIRGALLGEGA